MASGRKTGGRKKGTRNARTKQRLAIVDAATAEGVTPLEVMLDNMRFFHSEAGKLLTQIMGLTRLEGDAASSVLKTIMGARQAAQDAARDAAPYCHPKLASTEHSGPGGTPLFPPKIEIELVG